MFSPSVPSLSKRPSRHAVCMPCQIVREDEFRLLGRQILDLSEAGMLVASEEEVITGESLLVTFRMPFSRSWVDAEVTVARVIQGRRAGEHRRALGLVFEHIERHQRMLLRTNLAELPPRLPSRNQRVRGFASNGMIG